MVLIGEKMLHLAFAKYLHHENMPIVLTTRKEIILRKQISYANMLLLKRLLFIFLSLVTLFNLQPLTIVLYWITFNYIKVSYLCFYLCPR